MLNQRVNIKRNHDFISKVKDITKWLKNLKINIFLLMHVIDTNFKFWQLFNKTCRGYQLFDISKS